ncbi:hypothetical protein RCL1_006091 [Eukaryota sp. TZLM3-RCL]
MPSYNVSTISTTPFLDQQPGTSGLRKRTAHFEKQQNYIENFIASILECSVFKSRIPGSKLVIGGDGRYLCDVAIQKAVKIAAAYLASPNEKAHIMIAKDCLLSTPAASNVIRKYKCFGGLLCTASHNPGGPNADFGIKWNTENGGPAPLNVTESIFAASKELHSYKIVSQLEIDLSEISITEITVNNCQVVIEVFDGIQDYLELMKTLFDFNFLKETIKQFDISIVFDGLYGVSGPYASRIFSELGVPQENLWHCQALPDFGASLGPLYGHPDPSLVWAKELVHSVIDQHSHDFGFASDGDGDRNLQLSRGQFISPCDLIALLVLYHKYIPQFGSGIPGAARSMPTSAALDDICKHMKLDYYVTPTGWKFFSNLLDADKIALCGEESFGTSCNVHREKDGLWTVLAMLYTCCALSREQNRLVRPYDLCLNMWNLVGRRAFQRLDFEELPSDLAKTVFKNLEDICTNFHAAGLPVPAPCNLSLNSAENWSYTDPIDGSVVKNQGYSFTLSDTSRVVFRLSGTGSQGATIRIYVEKFVTRNYEQSTSDLTRELVDFALKLSRIAEITGKSEPDVVT